MANRRMFSLSVVGSDAFLTMPLTTQALYFHLGLRADDDGFINNALNIMRMVGANQNDFDLLIMKGFLIRFNDGVVVVKHWKINNNIRLDRYHQTEYTDDKKCLYLKPNKSYTTDASKGKSLEFVEEIEKCHTNGIPSLVKSSLGKVSIDTKIKPDKSNSDELLNMLVISNYINEEELKDTEWKDLFISLLTNHPYEDVKIKTKYFVDATKGKDIHNKFTYFKKSMEDAFSKPDDDMKEIIKKANELWGDNQNGN